MSEAVPFCRDTPGSQAARSDPPPVNKDPGSYEYMYITVINFSGKIL